MSSGTVGGTRFSSGVGGGSWEVAGNAITRNAAKIKRDGCFIGTF
tara:strand:- start:15875 stop:16009 length:135 start_codon:yes stop_codon:yes gene_type:complete